VRTIDVIDAIANTGSIRKTESIKRIKR